MAGIDESSWPRAGGRSQPECTDAGGLNTARDSQPRDADIRLPPLPPDDALRIVHLLERIQARSGRHMVTRWASYWSATTLTTTAPRSPATTPSSDPSTKTAISPSEQLHQLHPYLRLELHFTGQGHSGPTSAPSLVSGPWRP